MTKVCLLTALSLGTMLFASCENQAEVNPITSQSTTQSSTTTADLVGNWQLVAFTGVVPTPNTTDVKTTDIFAMLEDCNKDDKLHFESTGELVELPGTIECTIESDTEADAGAPAKPGSWALSSDQKTLTITLEEAKEYQVVSFTNTTLKLRSVGASTDPYTELEYKR